MERAAAKALPARKDSTKDYHHDSGSGAREGTDLPRYSNPKPNDPILSPSPLLATQRLLSRAAAGERRGGSALFAQSWGSSRA